jgi:hypothetical protein
MSQTHDFSTYLDDKCEGSSTIYAPASRPPAAALLDDGGAAAIAPPVLQLVLARLKEVCETGRISMTHLSTIIGGPKTASELRTWLQERRHWEPLCTALNLFHNDVEALGFEKALKNWPTRPGKTYAGHCQTDFVSFIIKSLVVAETQQVIEVLPKLSARNSPSHQPPAKRQRTDDDEEEEIAELKAQLAQLRAENERLKAALELRQTNLK